jgi:hypothetical protein
MQLKIKKKYIYLLKHYAIISDNYDPFTSTHKKKVLVVLVGWVTNLVWDVKQGCWELSTY